MCDRIDIILGWAQNLWMQLTHISSDDACHQSLSLSEIDNNNKNLTRHPVNGLLRPETWVHSSHLKLCSQLTAPIYILFCRPTRPPLSNLPLMTDSAPASDKDSTNTHQLWSQTMKTKNLFLWFNRNSCWIKIIYVGSAFTWTSYFSLIFALLLLRQRFI